MCASAHAPVHGERGGSRTNRAGPRRKERRKGCAGQLLDDWRSGPTRQRERERTGKKTGADRLAPLGNERGREGAREGELLLAGGVRMSDGAGAQACGLAGSTWAGWAAFPFSFSLNFLIPFPFLFL
jgi:hypothetical protein